VRTWPGLAAIGAGLIHLGAASGTAPAVLIPLAVLGGLEVLWGVVALGRPTPPAPRAAAIGVAVALLLSVVALLLPPAAARHGASVDLGVPAAAFGGAGALDLVLGVLLAIRLGIGLRDAGESHPLRFLTAAATAAAVVAVVTTQSLAATSVGGTMQMH
jgi:4-amino-4-deoxy-L-arabinose transferase-like glycosyltransferase